MRTFDRDLLSEMNDFNYTTKLFKKRISFFLQPYYSFTNSYEFELIYLHFHEYFINLDFTNRYKDPLYQFIESVLKCVIFIYLPAIRNLLLIDYKHLIIICKIEN